MKLLIIGGHGMAGHILKQYFMQQPACEVWSTVRAASQTDSRAVALDVRDAAGVKQLLDRLRPDVVVNAVGLLNDETRLRQAEAIYVNSLFPHVLEQFAESYDFRLVHISTDCVFSGSRGDYTETDPADAISIYGKTKSLGEVTGPKTITFRTSIIGPELKQNGIGLFHWFMRQSGDIQGYRQVFWNGVTTLELAKAIDWCLGQPIQGLVHLSGRQKLSKYELLLLLQQQFHHQSVNILANDDIQSDKSLVSTRADFSYAVPPYAQMIFELKEWMDRHGQGVYSYPQ
ncbi:dTDP-4-dehydrorhamnose reductase family protein [Paenibacillus sedimenti]|uniref:dTDP-4-dehydrorhamnose reductase n=1 Tax=Paenibacillus sedimenti TaxID=2770274 RepID=A0A926KTA2_9BACL|nr:SDR family oxidoreductase [Paenibacillus sedimenti]MBD0381590.1 SDR family oxidoreductase [Paenibacillus sedimenti]